MRNCRWWQRFARSNIAVPKPPYSQSISQRRLPSSRKLPGKEIVVAEDDRQRHLRSLERVDQRQVSRQRVVTVVPRGSERACVIADDVKHPERVRRTPEMARKLAVAGHEDRDDSLDVCPQVGFREGGAVDVPKDHDARLGVDHFRRQPRRVRGDTGRALAVAENVMDRQVVSAARDEAIASSRTTNAVLDSPPRSGSSVTLPRQHGSAATRASRSKVVRVTTRGGSFERCREPRILTPPDWPSPPLRSTRDRHRVRPGCAGAHP